MTITDRDYSAAMLPLTLLVLLTVLSGVSTGDALGDDCGVYGREVPTPPKGAKLTQVHAVIR